MVTASTVIFVNSFLMVTALGLSIALLKNCPPSSRSSRIGGRWGCISRLWYSQIRIFAVFFILLGFKLFWIHHYVTNIPFWDQWSAEGLRLYLPLLNDELNWATLFSAHNEHRIFWSRFWALGQFLLNSQWDIQWQTVANAVWHSATGALFFELVVRYFKERGEILWILVFASLFVAPFTWQNLLSGFQSCFYFFQFFGAASIVLLFGTPVLSKSWFLGWVALVFSYFALAAAALVAGVIMVAAVLRMVLPGSERRWGFDLGWVFCALALFLLGIWLTPEVPHHEALRATSLGHLISNFFHLAAWPFYNLKFSLNQAVSVSFLLWLPWLSCVIIGFFSFEFRRRLGPGYWILLCFGGWVVASFLATAYSRGSAPAYGFSWRYADLFGMGCLTAIISMLVLCFGRFPKFWSRLFLGVSVASAMTWGMGMYHINTFAVDIILPHVRSNGTTQVENVNGYVQTGNPAFLYGKERLDIPLHDPVQLEKFLLNSQYRALLPWTVREPIPLSMTPDSPAKFLPSGLPPSMKPRSGETSWGSYHPQWGAGYIARAEFSLARDPRLPFLVTFLAGYPREEGIQIVARAEGIEDQSIWRTKPGRFWLDRRFTSGEGHLRILAEDLSESSWVAFSEPRELGWYSFASIWVAKRFDIFLSLGLALVGVVLVARPLVFRMSFYFHLIRCRQRVRYAVAAFRSAWREWESKASAD